MQANLKETAKEIALKVCRLNELEAGKRYSFAISFDDEHNIHNLITQQADICEPVPFSLCRVNSLINHCIEPYRYVGSIDESGIIAFYTVREVI